MSDFIRMLARPSVAKTAPADPARRRVLSALGALPLAATLASLPRVSRAAASTTVIEGRNGWLFPGWESLTDDATAACVKNVDLMQRAAQTLAARKIRCVVVIAPLKARSCAANLPDGMTLPPALQQRLENLRAHGKSIGLPIINADLAISGIGADIDPYVRADYHWSAHSAEAVAARTAARLATFGPLPGAAGGGAKLGNWTEEVHFGDLAELMPPDKKKAIGKDHFIVRSVAQQTALLDGGPDVVQVVGNSMVQPYLGFTQKLSHMLDRRVGLTWTFGDTGPWKTLLNYLESPAFASQPPYAIVWQFNEGQMMNGPGAAGQWDASSVMAEDAWLARVAKAVGA
jgi:alginate O-acetyltransferase complex protein AlgJ